ncbi:MAG: hypothetical protein RIS94_21 [Pseudomonadota bacterium]|jgi:hypothetical protein
MATTIAPADQPSSTPLGPGKGLAMLAIVVVAVAAFIGISHALGLPSVYGGFLFVFYFTGLCHAAPDKFVPSVAGAFFGLSLAWMLSQLPVLMGMAGMGIALGVVLAAVYALIMGWVPLLVNHAAMLFLTVGTIPALHETATLAEMALSVLLAVVLLGAALLAARLRK